MIFATATIYAIALILTFAAYKRKDRSHTKGFKIAVKTVYKMIPLLLAAFAISGLIEAAVPPQFIQNLLGEESGLKGILLGTFAGIALPGGPYLTLPIMASIYNSGAGIGTIVALITGWALLGIGLVPFEMAFVSPRFTLMRISIVAFIPIISGIIAQAVF